MAITKCKECGKEISTSAKTCPSCGAHAKKRSGCGLLAVILLVLVGIGAIGELQKQKTVTATPGSSPVTSVAGTPSEPGYNDGFIVGEARHNNKDPGLDPGRLELLARVNSQSYNEAGSGHSASDFQRAYLQGYKDGFAGKSRGGGEQSPLPALPITISQSPNLVSKKLGDITPSDLTPLQVLAALVAKNPDKNVFVVVAHCRYNQNTSEYVKCLYDRRRQIFLKLTRMEEKRLADAFSWTLSLDTPPDSLTEEGLWGLDSTTRQIKSKSDEAKATVPLIYEQNAALTRWP